MKRALIILLLAGFNVCSAGEIKIENPPLPIDLQLADRMWVYIKQQTGAPATVPAPIITMDWEVPIMARMGTQYPTLEDATVRLQISIAPRTVDMWPPEMVMYGLAHEMAHYALILKENDWDATKKVYTVKRKHHCDPEFKAITRGVADQLWNVWHSDTLRSKMYDEVIKSCSNQPDQ